MFHISIFVNNLLIDPIKGKIEIKGFSFMKEKQPNVRKTPI
jgi:hypothetical protein